jgi:two-component system LytT family response regulator
VKPIRTLIVDDEPAARDAIRHLLRDVAGIQVVGECRNGREALDTLTRGGIDLVFLDVQMPVVDGLTVAARLDRASLPVMVFVTAFDQYALRAFEVHAVDYLLKPFTDDRFHKAVERALEVIAGGRERELTDRVRALLLDLHAARPQPPGPYLSRLPLRSGDRTTLLSVRDVDWIGAEGDYAAVHAGRHRHLLRETMRSLAASLDPAQFARIHRSAIVNLDRVAELRALDKGEFAVVLRDGTRLKLSRGFKDAFEAQLGRRL